MNTETIAQVAHQVNKAYCKALGDTTQVDWEQSEEWQKQSAINGVQFIIDNPDTTPAQLHQNWLEQKEKEGWKHGTVKDVAKKEHPCFVQYEQLPIEQRAKDFIFAEIVRTLLPIKTK